MLKMRITSALFLGLMLSAPLGAQSTDSLAIFTNPSPHKLVNLPADAAFKEHPKNIILLIGDGMGLAQLHAAKTANGGALNITTLKHMGLIDTQSADNYITDSAAGGTALATGQRVNNGVIAQDAEGRPIRSILHLSEENGKATGLVSTSGITHATPASFIAHDISRNNYEAIAADFLETDIDLFIGGGLEHFTKREDGRDLSRELEAKGYKVFTSLEAAEKAKNGPMAIFTAEGHNPVYPERGDMLPMATQKALEVLSARQAGFFIMIEGSQIDWGGHDNSTPYIVQEALDFDRAVGAALEFAAANGETLVIVTADHETGGMTINGGSDQELTVNARYTSENHTAVMVPVFAYGPGAENFMGVYKNTDIFEKMKALFKF